MTILTSIVNVMEASRSNLTAVFLAGALLLIIVAIFTQTYGSGGRK